MDLRKEIINAVQLVCLLCLLYWSCTWNIPANYDAFQWDNGKFSKAELQNNAKRVELCRKYTPLVLNKYEVILDSFKDIKSVRRKDLRASTLENSMLPSFYEWKELELSKQGRSETSEKNLNTNRSDGRRKLNYASSKCGAKILASNSEAKYKTAILNEKRDEYMLNPCRTVTWFVIELCDAIEVTQIELANYELYSSSPKEFAAYWSDVFPTQTWHQLGKFEAKDRRTMQTFDLKPRNLGKFIKIIIYSHHGKEHYCPLSVLRILGYSMVYEYVDMEENIGSKDAQKHINAGSISEQEVKQNLTLTKGNSSLSTLNAKNKNETGTYIRNGPQTFLSTRKICQIVEKYCANAKLKMQGKCKNTASCLFLKKVVFKSWRKPDCNFVCRRRVKSKHAASNKNQPYADLEKEQICDKSINKSHDMSLSPSRRFNAENSMKEYRGIKTKNHKTTGVTVHTDTNVKEHDKTKIHQMSRAPEMTLKNRRDKQIKCDCENRKDFALPNEIQASSSMQISQSELFGDEDSSESAALIQKGSVLLKMNSRIKDLELNLNLINRYLEQLSQSYRQQMEDMQDMFNNTVKALTVASEKAIMIDNRQQDDLDLLEHQIISLNTKIEYLNDGHEHLLKRVVELHVFFLILELILLSAVFTIFVNNLKTNKAKLARKYSTRRYLV